MGERSMPEKREDMLLRATLVETLIQARTTTAY